MGDDSELRLQEVSDNFSLVFKSDAQDIEMQENIKITDLNFGMPISELEKLIG